MKPKEYRTLRVESKSEPGTFHYVNVMAVPLGFAYRCDCIAYTMRKQRQFLVIKDWSCSHITKIKTEVDNERSKTQGSS